jgi:hypothetical protein
MNNDFINHKTYSSKTKTKLHQRTWPMVCEDEVLYFGFGAPKKEKYPSSMGDFRPMACCDVLYIYKLACDKNPS